MNFNKYYQRAKILIVDDEQEALDIFKRQLEDEYEIDTADSSASALKKLSQELYQIVMTDVVMPDENGIELMKKIKAKWPHISVMMVSGKSSVEMAVEAMKLGAEDFIEKPVEDLDLLKLVIRKILKVKWQTDEIERLRRILNQDFDRSNIVGNSYEIQKIMEKVKIIAPLDITVLITGETGVGKEVFANLLYRNSKRKNRKFVTVNCGSLPESLLESMLFGHKKGAFTDAIRNKIGYFQEADGGTLFLDEITETSPSFQVKLLRVLEKGVIRQVGGDEDINTDVRIIAATNKDIEEEVKNHNFREDLYYRLNVVNIHIPPLRNRVEDIKLLAKSFVDEFSQKYNKPDLAISIPVMSLITSYEWKGNIRELKNAIEHAVALASHTKIIPEDLPSNIYQNSVNNKFNFTDDFMNLPFSKAKQKFEENYLRCIIEACNGNITKAAEISGIKRQNIYDKFNRYNINVKRRKKI